MRRVYNQQIRKLIGMTQGELAKKIGTTQSTVCRYENGDRSPKFIEISIELALDEGIKMYVETLNQLQAKRNEEEP